MQGSYVEFLLILGLWWIRIGFGSSLQNSTVRCIEKERQALLQFKQGLQDDQRFLSSWSNQEDCCKWEGITCSNQTGYVVTLDLGYYYSGLKGEISHSLLRLQHLTYLDLSFCNFSDKSLPEFIGSFTKLQHLDLSSTEIIGTIPQQIGNLTHLISLELGWNKLIEDHNLDWLLNMSSLRHLNLANVDLSKAIDWPYKVSVLPSLTELHLSGCGLHMPISPKLPNVSSSSPLSILSLDFNNISSSIIFPWLFKYNSTLVSLDLSMNMLQGFIPKGFGNLHNLQVLYLSHNEVCGEITNLLKLPSFRELDLSYNRLKGSLTKGLGKLSKLKVLDMACNSLEGDLTEAHLSNLSTLEYLDLSYNSLSLSFNPTWKPSFQLKGIGLGSCKLDVAFPQWLQTQKNFSSLDISDAGISVSIPNWFWDLSSSISLLNLSHNQINGVIPFQWFWRLPYINMVDLSYNGFTSPLPQINSPLSVVILSNNLFYGSIISFCPKNKSKSHFFFAIDLSYNFLSGELPECLANHSNFLVLNLEENNFSGRNTKFIERMCSHPSLKALHLLRNNLSGELSPIMNCSLDLLDLGENRLLGRIPIFKKAHQGSMKILSLRSNLFSGSIPLQLCNLELLQILDLSQNKITGSIPKCLNNFIVLAQSSYGNYQSFLFSFNSFEYYEYLSVIVKDIRLKYTTNLGLLGFIDLSNNELKGEVPTEITSLLGLLGLNLLGNHLTGMMPQRIGDMKALESLDFSRNHLSGNIPPSLATLTFLNHLNLSNNNFSGRIPTSTQLQSFNASAYEGNPYLCGLPLMERCLEDKVVQGSQIGGKHGQGNTQVHVNFYKHLGFYSSIMIGFTIGLWGVCGMLLLKSSWRHAYFQCVDHIGGKLYITIVILKATLLRNFKAQY